MVGTSQSSFDVSNESDVISLLKIVHQNSIDPDVKNHLRDLIFAYRQDQNDTQFIKLQVAFSLLGVTTVNGEKKEVQQTVKLQVNQGVKTAEKKSTLGNMNRQPRFARVAYENETSNAKVQEPAAVLHREVPEVTIEQKVIVDSPAVTLHTETLSTPHVPVANYTQRIMEIKKIVNEKVGNPVNLIDANNEVGREYMNALLDAMKKTNGGQPEEVESAMTRLENAFARVQQVILNEKPNQAEGATDLEPVKGPESEYPKVSLQDKNAVIEEVKEIIEPTPSKVQEIPKVQEEVPVKIPVVAPKMSSVLDTLNIAKPKQAEAQMPSANTSEVVHSVAKEKQLQDLMRANREKIAETYQQQEATRISAMDPLQVPEVTAGLGQLLSEWNLFKSSGIFGTGPSGKDHILYQKLAPLTMATVISGRFEGATPHIKQSITDYMNGWRYEEGIIHEHGETFEHYLRRVIKHILEKQKKGKL